jgi:hypothetical protein
VRDSARRVITHPTATSPWRGEVGPRQRAGRG